MAEATEDGADAMRLEARRIGREVEGRMLLQDVSLTLTGGDRLGLVGRTGSGKTLLLRSLALLDPVSIGQVLWRGEPVHGKAVPEFRRRVIYLHQRPALEEGTVELNLRKPFSYRVHSGSALDRDVILSLLDALERPVSFLSQRTRDLSGGEAQLTALLRALQLGPQILLLDEPTASLDTETTKLVEKLLGDWIDERPSVRATVWVTHDRDQALRVSAEVRELREGRLD